MRLIYWSNHRRQVINARVTSPSNLQPHPITDRYLVTMLGCVPPTFWSLRYLIIDGMIRLKNPVRHNVMILRPGCGPQRPVFLSDHQLHG
jgi:hypothetical protein